MERGVRPGRGLPSGPEIGGRVVGARPGPVTRRGAEAAAVPGAAAAPSPGAAAAAPAGRGAAGGRNFPRCWGTTKGRGGPRVLPAPPRLPAVSGPGARDAARRDAPLRCRHRGGAARVWDAGRGCV